MPAGWHRGACLQPRRVENILAWCYYDIKVEMVQLLLDNFPRLVSEREGVDETLIQIIKTPFQTPEIVKIAKLILQHPQATPGLVGGNVDKYLAEAVRSGWSDMCRMLVVDAHANAQTVVKRSTSGRLELKGHCLKDRPPNYYREPDEKVLKGITACLSEEVLRAITAAPETGNE